MYFCECMIMTYALFIQLCVIVIVFNVTLVTENILCCTALSTVIVFNVTLVTENILCSTALSTVIVAQLLKASVINWRNRP